ncbi:MAG: deoxyhypusine synthase [Candidatus Parcubacteria bacterium]|nr:MAG: deoxyhypusine synthase [Candidatus Parcubacteria bacterium]
MTRKNFFPQKVKAFNVQRKRNVLQIIEAMKQTAFQGRRLAQVVDVWSKMVSDKKVTIFLGYAGSLSTAGQWRGICWLIENGFVDVIVATGANLSEDIVEAMGKSYYQINGNFDDEWLLKNNCNRYYDIYGKEKDYMQMTELIADFILTLENNHPFFCPAIIDSPYGDAGLIAKSKGFNLIIDSMKDYIEFMSLAKEIKETGVIYLGGGVPKDFIQLLAVTANLLYDNREVPNKKVKIKRIIDKEIKESYYPHKYAIQITTDAPQWGGLSGCTFEEAISWGKIDSRGNFVQCYCDVTIALPIILHALSLKVNKKRKRTLFNFYGPVAQW